MRTSWKSNPTTEFLNTRSFDSSSSFESLVSFCNLTNNESSGIEMPASMSLPESPSAGQFRFSSHDELASELEAAKRSELSWLPQHVPTWSCGLQHWRANKRLLHAFALLPTCAPPYPENERAIASNSRRGYIDRPFAGPDPRPTRAQTCRVPLHRIRLDDLHGKRIAWIIRPCNDMSPARITIPNAKRQRAQAVVL